MHFFRHVTKKQSNTDSVKKTKLLVFTGIVFILDFTLRFVPNIILFFLCLAQYIILCRLASRIADRYFGSFGVDNDSCYYNIFGIFHKKSGISIAKNCIRHQPDSIAFHMFYRSSQLTHLRRMGHYIQFTGCEHRCIARRSCRYLFRLFVAGSVVDFLCRPVNWLFYSIPALPLIGKYIRG